MDTMSLYNMFFVFILKLLIFSKLTSFLFYSRVFFQLSGWPSRPWLIAFIPQKATCESSFLVFCWLNLNLNLTYLELEYRILGNESNFDERGNQGCRGNEAQVGFRSTASQRTCNGSRGGIRDLWAFRQPNSTKAWARGFSKWSPI